MAYVIAEPCIGVKDGACVAACPVDCIHPAPGEAEFNQCEQLYIDPNQCIDCGMCVEECPVKAIFEAADLPAHWLSYVEKNAAHYRKGG